MKPDFYSKQIQSLKQISQEVFGDSLALTEKIENLRAAVEEYNKNAQVYDDYRSLLEGPVGQYLVRLETANQHVVTTSWKSLAMMDLKSEISRTKDILNRETNSGFKVAYSRIIKDYEAQQEAKEKLSKNPEFKKLQIAAELLRDKDDAPFFNVLGFWNKLIGVKDAEKEVYAELYSHFDKMTPSAPNPCRDFKL